MKEIKNIETKKYLLREFKLIDAKDMFKNWANDVEVAKYMLYPLNDTLEKCENAIKYFIEEAQNGKYHNFSIVNKENNEVIGSIGISINTKHNFGDISFLLAKQYQHKGILSEIMPYFLDYAFKYQNLNMIFGEVMEKNEASRKALGKFNFKLDGTVRKKYVDRFGTYHNICVYSLLNEEYK